jgi:vacuolar protein sorting-associated protein 16
MSSTALRHCSLSSVFDLVFLFAEETLRAKYGSFEVAPITSSVTVTITAVLNYAAVSQNEREKHQLLADADKLARKARISEKRLWHIKVKAYADGGYWNKLQELADSTRKPPIGYKPFAHAAIKGKRDKKDILLFIQRLGTPVERFDLLCEAAMWKEALKIAEKEMKDGRRISQVKNRCNDKEVQLEADQALGRLAT